MKLAGSGRGASGNCRGDHRHRRHAAAVLLIALASLITLVGLARASVQAAFDCSPSCAVTPGTTVTFTSSSTSSSPIRNYEWDLDGDDLFGAADDPDEPYGPSAQTAQRSFPAPGSFQVGLRVTNAGAERSTAIRTVTVSSEPPPPPPSPPPPPPPPPPPGQLQPVPVTFAKQRVHGPFVVTGRALRRALRGPSPRPAPEEETDDDRAGLAEPPPPCGAPICDGGYQPPATARPASPPLSAGPFGCCDREIDPQIAASNSALLVGLRHHVQAFDKAGQPLYFPDTGQVAQQEAKPYDLNLCKIFKPIIGDINAKIPLPTDLEDNQGNAITVENGYGINCDKATGGTRPANWWDLNGKDGITDADFYWDEFFDARVVWDEYHNRFVIAALLMNHNTNARKAQARKDAGSVNAGTYNAVKARRSLLAVAVSKSEDPRDGFYEYWLWGYPAANACAAGNHCFFHGAIDYLSAGISSKYLVLESTIGDQNAQGVHDPADDNLPDLINGKIRREITLIPTAALVGGQSPAQQQVAWQNVDPFTNPDGTEVGQILQPAVQHAPDLGGYHLFANKWVNRKGTAENEADDERELLLWALSLPTQGQPKMYNTPLPLQTYRDVDALAPQKVHADFISEFPPLAFAGLATNWVNKLVYRKAKLYLTFDTCGTSGDALVQDESGAVVSKDVCKQSILRFARLELDGIDNFGGQLTAHWGDAQVDRNFGAPDSFEPQFFGNAWYAFPTVEVNGAGDAALLFHRSGTSVYPEARYSVYLHGDPDIRASALLAKGDYTLGSGATPQGSWHHYAGMSVDPYDDTAIWMIQGFAKKNGYRVGIWRYAIGKVFSKPFPNLSLEAALLSAPGSGSKGLKRQLRLRLGNLGDGAARATKARVLLTRKPGAGASERRAAGEIPLKTIGVPRIASGAARVIRLELRLPSGARYRGYRYLRIRLDVRRRVKEYDERDNSIYVRLR